MIDIFLFLGLVFLLTFLVGKLLEKIRVPWIFAALLVGSLLAIYNPFESITSSSTFGFLAQLGMYMLLFIIGFEIDLKKLRKSKSFVFKTMFFTLFLEAFFGSIFIHLVFGYSWFISALVALSFATVGEAILIPILDEFKIVNTKLGQSIIGIGTLDDIIEVLLLILVVILVGSKVYSGFNIFLIIVSFAVLVVLTIGLSKLKIKNEKFKFLPVEYLFLFILFILFLFLGIGELAQATPIAAFLAGVALNSFIPKIRKGEVKSGIKILGYGLFAPIFFLWVGASLDMRYLFAFPLLILLVVVISNGSKLLGSWIVGRKELGTKKSILLGVGLSARFSTSIVLIKILFDNGFIGKDLYSVIIASTIVFTFVVPILFSNLLVRWKIIKTKK